MRARSWRRERAALIPEPQGENPGKIPFSKRFVRFVADTRDLACGFGRSTVLGTWGMSDFKILVEQLGDERTTFDFEVSRGWWSSRQVGPAASGEAGEETPGGPFQFRLEAGRVGEGVSLEGECRGPLDLECSRCAKRYPHALHEEFRLTLEPARGHEPRDPEGELGLAEKGLTLGEDLEAGWFRGPLIRLDDFFGEVIAMAMPIQPLCREDCPGICAHCGMDFSVSRCDCSDEKIDSPFAVLAQLKQSE